MPLVGFRFPGDLGIAQAVFTLSFVVLFSGYLCIAYQVHLSFVFGLRGLGVL